MEQQANVMQGLVLINLRFDRTGFIFETLRQSQVAARRSM